MAQTSTLTLDHNQAPPAFLRQPKTPLWNTFESDFNHDDFSDDSDDDDFNQFIEQKQDKVTKIKLINMKSVPPKRTRHIDPFLLSAAAPNLASSTSVPIKDMKHHKVDMPDLTIWSKHKEELKDLLQKEVKNVKFKDMDNDDKSQTDEVRMYLIGEIINTEQCYVNGLNTLLYEFIIPMFDHKLIEMKYKESITCNIPEILLFHKQFLDALTVGHDNILSVFVDKLCNNDFVEMYTKYIKEYQTMLDIYAKYNKSKKLQQYLKAKRKEKKPLTNHLILPIQRITRYLLLLQELKTKTPSTHKDYDELECVLDRINETVNTINERQREIENMSQCLQIQDSLDGLDMNIVEANRKLLHQFVFRKKENQRGRQFFVFNDLLIITNLKLKVKAAIEMRTIDIKREDEMSLVFHLYSLEHDAVYETDEIEDLDTLDLMIEDNREMVHLQSLRRVGAEDMASMLTNTHSVSGCSLKMYKSVESLNELNEMD